MTERAAKDIPQTWITDARTVTITGRLISTCDIGDQVRVEVVVGRDAVVEAAPPAA